MRSADPDAELVARIAHGDQEALSALYGRHLDTVLAYLHRRTGDAELAFDLAAETFAAVVLGARRHRPAPQPVATWLIGVARHELLDSVRRGRVRSAARRRLCLEPVALAGRELERVRERASAGSDRLGELFAELPDEIREALLARVAGRRALATSRGVVARNPAAPRGASAIEDLEGQLRHAVARRRHRGSRLRRRR